MQEKSMALAKVDNYLNSPEINGLVSSMLQGAAKNFLADVRTLCFNNPALAECDQPSLLGCALKAHAIGLRLDPQFGQAYIIPYKKSVFINGKWEKYPVAQFQMGVRGWIQLAMRTREYVKLNACTVKEGEFAGRDMFGDPMIVFAPEKERVKLPVCGYMAAFQMVNGMVKILYWSVEEFEAHATRYSESYRQYKESKNDKSKKSKKDNVWETSYDQMGEKTVLTHLLRKFGYMSAEMQEAYAADQAALQVDENGEIVAEYVDNQPEVKINFITTEQLKALGEKVGRSKKRQELARDIIRNTYQISDLKRIPAEIFDEIMEVMDVAFDRLGVNTEVEPPLPVEPEPDVFKEAGEQLGLEG